MKAIKNSVLVCITPQSNSNRLIDVGHELSLKEEAELHILHVEKGNNIFSTDESSILLRSLFDYGTELGGIVHGLCGENVTKVIRKFIISENITHLILGHPPKNIPVTKDSIISELTTYFPYLIIQIV